MERVCPEWRLSDSIRVDNGPELFSRSLNPWPYWNNWRLDFSRPVKLTDKASIESFHGTLRDEYLDQHGYLSLEDAQEKLDAWRKDDNHCRPHSSLINQSPMHYAAESDLSSGATVG